IGAMAALLALDYDAALAIAKQAAEETGGGAICEGANDNGGGQVVVSGSRAAVHCAIEIAKAQSARRSILLPVSAPFHCALMQPAAEAMAAALATAAIKPPCVALVSNVLAAAVTAPEKSWRDLSKGSPARRAAFQLEFRPTSIFTGPWLKPWRPAREFHCRMFELTGKTAL